MDYNKKKEIEFEFETLGGPALVDTPQRVNLLVG